MSSPTHGRALCTPIRSAPPMIRRHGPDAAGVDPLLPGTVRIEAFAKVNLFLEVLGRRLDGYHEIATLMLAIDLADELEFAPDDAGGLSLTCDDPALSTGPENLVLRAARGCVRRPGVEKAPASSCANGSPGPRASVADRAMRPRPWKGLTNCGSWDSPRQPWPESARRLAVTCRSS